MRIIQEIITPERARQILTHNPSNRRIRSSVIHALSLMIERGEWKLTHQGIAIGIDGSLIDGQHRLTAIVETGVALPMMIAYDVPRDTFTTIDRGVKRDLRDHIGEDKFISQPLGFLTKFLYHSTYSIDQALYLRKKLEPYLEQFRAGASGTDRRSVSSSPVKAAAIVSLLKGEDFKRVVEIYNMMVNFDTTNPRMPVCAHAMLRQSETGGTRKIQPMVTFIKALKVFDSTQANNRHLGVKDLVSAVQTIREDLREMIKTMDDADAA